MQWYSLYCHGPNLKSQQQIATHIDEKSFEKGISYEPSSLP